MEIKVLNLYAGLGGNRKFWDNCEVTSVELDEKLWETYHQLYPNDCVVQGDAHEFLLEYHQDFDFIWSSPPCQSHSRMIRGGKNRKPRYVDLKLYEEILFLQNDYDGLWVVENVVPWYSPLVPPSSKVGRHLFWSNFDFDAKEVPQPNDFIKGTNVAASEALKDWLGIHYEGNIYYGSNHCPAQVLRNCVHPLVGKSIFDRVTALMIEKDFKELNHEV